MDGDLGLWPESYYDHYGSIGNNDSHVEYGDVEFNMPYGPLATELADTMNFVQSIPTDLLRFSDVAHAQNVRYLPPGNMSTGQRQQANQQLYINTQLCLSQIDESENSTASSSPFSQLLPTPCSQLYPSLLSSIHIPSPRSASVESRMLIPELEKMSFPVSPSLTLDGDVLDDATSPLLTEDDIVTQSPMPHILEWTRVIEPCGTNDFVPQLVYQPHTEADKKRYIQDVELQKTIFFHSGGSCEWGVFLNDALTQKLRNLKDKEDPMFVGCGPSVSIRIQWPGYPPWSKQIPTMDFKTPKGPITRAKLAKNIATCIRRFAESVQNRPMEAGSDRRWKIGKQHIRVEDLILVSLHHVSKGSWQPQLRLRRPLTVFPSHWDKFLPLVPAS